MMDRPRRQRVADVSEKLGVGLFLAVFAQGIFAARLTPQTIGLAVIALVIASALIAVSVALSQED